MIYNAVRPNYKEKFFKADFIPDEIYDALKEKNIRSQDIVKEKEDKWYIRFIRLVKALIGSKLMSKKKISEVIRVTEKTLRYILADVSEKEEKFKGNSE